MAYQIQPGEKMSIARVLADHTDTTTYYVQAVIRRADDDTLLDTVNLTDRGSQRFSNTWDVPYYPTATYVIITTSVYTDSGYTTKSPNYGDEANTYVIADRWSVQFAGSGRGVNYDRLREVFSEELDKIKPPEPKDVDLSGVSKKEDAESIKREVELMRDSFVDVLADQFRGQAEAIDSVARSVSSLQGEMRRVMQEQMTVEIRENAEGIRGVLDMMKDTLAEMKRTGSAELKDSAGVLRSRIEQLEKNLSQSEENIMKSVEQTAADTMKMLFNSIAGEFSKELDDKLFITVHPPKTEKESKDGSGKERRTPAGKALWEAFNRMSPKGK